MERQLVKAHAHHSLENKAAGIRKVQQQLCQRLPVAVGNATTAVDEIIHELPAQRVALRQRLCRQLGQIQNTNALFSKHVRKAVMLRLRALKIWDVVKEQALHGIGCKLLQFAARPVQQHGAKLADLAFYIDCHANSPLILILTLFFYSITEKRRNQ